MRLRVLASLAITLAAALLASSCTTDGELGPKIDGTGEWGPQTAGQAFLVGSIPLCREGHGTSPITVDGVRALDGDLEVTSFAIRDNPFETDGVMIGNANGTLAANGLHHDPDFQITERCDAPESSHQFGYELIVELRAADHDTSTSGFAISYHGNHHRGTLKDGLEVYSCVDNSTPQCQR